MLGLALFLGAVVAAPSRAEACSAPEAVQFSFGPGDAAPIAREGVVVVGVSFMYPMAPTTLRVVDLASSTEVPGSVEAINLGAPPEDPYNVTYYTRFLYVWRATGAFDPAGSYQVEVSSGMFVQELPGVVAEADHPGPPAPDTTFFRAERSYEWSYDCVETDPGLYCFYCDRRDPVGVVNVLWAPGPEVVDPFVTYRVVEDPGEGSGEPVWRPLGWRGLTGLWHATLVYRTPAEQYCATVTSTSLIDGTTSTTGRYCAVDADLAELGPPPMPRGDGGPGAWDGGAGFPDSGGDVLDAGGDVLDAGSGTFDGGPFDGGDPPGLGGGGGCSVTAAALGGGPVFAALAVAAGLLCRRRR
ncbi:MAG: hypothetical protein DRJ42_14115 [Deltaproteobacteria bacterium]|nr:MAG: hypothetical protein DRJ42_14115 [Deltaproteobacteria bacterium]